MVTIKNDSGSTANILNHENRGDDRTVAPHQRASTSIYISYHREKPLEVASFNRSCRFADVNWQIQRNCGGAWEFHAHAGGRATLVIKPDGDIVIGR
ncbi:hypothetical protein BE21_31420 [Sorangium cellulosum]|uniref:Uncharacterized protein n=1 Tax=Sorangium cellulosum TaxID=56 RepID=A0A150TRE8_SORCE|nr:hypothetical protein BE21_31420 [Sorangium cellulosum]